MFRDLLLLYLPTVLVDAIIEYLSCDDHLQAKVIPSPDLLKQRLKVYPPGHPEATACYLLLHRRTPKLTLDQIYILPSHIRHLVFVYMQTDSRSPKEVSDLTKYELAHRDIHVLLKHPQLSFNEGRTGINLLSHILTAGRCEHTVAILSHPKLTLGYFHLEAVILRGDIYIQAVLPLYQSMPQMIRQAVCFCIENRKDDLVKLIIPFIVEERPYTQPIQYDPMITALKHRVKLIPYLLELNFYQKDFDYTTITKAKTKQVYVDLITQSQRRIATK